MKKRWLSIVLALVMALGLAPVPAQAAGIGETEIRVNETKVAFGGREWWVIGDGSSGVFPQAEHITLWAVDAGGDLGCMPWRRGTAEQRADTKKYDCDGRDIYYDNNPSGMKAWNKPAEYAGSTIQQKMEELVNALPEKERRLLWGRTLTVQNDGIYGQDAENQKMWILSIAEYESVSSEAVRLFGKSYWTRDVAYNTGIRARHIPDNYVPVPATISFNWLQLEYHYPRPAATMTMRNWVFTSGADATGKSAATVGGGLVKMEKPEGTIKFTMKSSAQTLRVYATDQWMTDTLHFAYSDAPVGENQYVSCLIKDEQGNMLYYGKLAGCAESGSGTVELKLPDETRGKNLVVSIFSEEANGDRYTDFCSENPVTIKLKSEGGGQTWSVEDFTGETHTHQWDGDAWTADDDGHWHACKAANCPLGENRLKDGYGEHVYDQKIEKYEYKFDGPQCDRPALYFYSCVCGKAGKEMFTVGEARHFWNTSQQIPGEDKHWHKCINCRLEETVPCYGGEAWCKYRAMCDGCYEEYGTVDPNHHVNSNYSWTQTAETHGKYYSCCGATVEVEKHVWESGACSVCGYPCDHTGGTATCTKKAVCVSCGGEYGNLNAENHDPAAEWTQENGKHYHVCKNGCGTHVDEAACSGGTANCMKKAECAVCGGEYGTVNAENHDPSTEWTQENGKHYHACKNGCGTHLDEAACSGGGADCQHKAVCRICQKEYGELGMHSFSENPGWAATCMEDGQKAHWKCADCHMLVLMDGEKVTQTELIIPATGHDWGEAEWSWNEDGTAAAVRFTCKNDGTHIEEPAVDMTHRTTPAGCTRAGETVYTAKATFENGLYTDGRTTVLDALGHEVTHVAALAPTETEAGHTEHWVCARCGLYFGDEALTQPVLQEDTILPATGKGTPTTGDSGNLTLWAALLAVSGGAWPALLRRRRER